MGIDYSSLLTDPLFRSKQDQNKQSVTAPVQQENSPKTNTPYGTSMDEINPLESNETYLQVFSEFPKHSCAIVALSSVTGIPPHKISLAYHRIIKEHTDESAVNVYIWWKYVRTGKMRELYQALQIEAQHPGIKFPYFNNVDYPGVYYTDDLLTINDAVVQMQNEDDYSESMYIFMLYNEGRKVMHDVGFSNGYYIDQHVRIPTDYRKLNNPRVFAINKIEKWISPDNVDHETGGLDIVPAAYELNVVNVDKLQANADFAQKENARRTANKDRSDWLSNDLDNSITPNVDSEIDTEDDGSENENDEKPSGTILKPTVKSGISVAHLPKSTNDIPSLEDLLSESFNTVSVPQTQNYLNTGFQPYHHEVEDDAEFITGHSLGFSDNPYKSITWKPRSYQLEAFNRFKDDEYFALLFDMGTGKTKTAIDIGVYKFETGQIDMILVLAPNMVHQQWCKQQFPEHCCIDYEYMVWSRKNSTNFQYQQRLDNFLRKPYAGKSTDRPKQDRKLKVFFVNIESVQGKVYGSDARASLQNIFSKLATLFKNFNPFIILDESSRIKNPDTNTSEIIQKMQRYGQRCILSGTPATKRPENLWAQYEFLFKDFFGVGVTFETFKSWYEIRKNPTRQKRRKKVTVQEARRVRDQVDKLNDQYDTLEKIGVKVDRPNIFAQVAKENGMQERDVQYLANHQEFTDYKGLDELKAKIAPCTLSVKKEDIDDQLPPLTYTTLNVELTAEQKRMYVDMKKWGVAELEQDNPDTSAEAMGILAILRRCMQIVGGHFPVRNESAISGEKAWNTTRIFKNGKNNPKIRAMLSDIEDNSVDYAIIWAIHTEEVIQIGQVLEEEGYSVGLLYGAVPDEERFALVERFLNKEFNFFVINPKVGSKGLNLQTCSLSYFYSVDFNVENRLQARDRIHRLGQKADKVIIRDVTATDSIDLDIHQKLIEGERLNDFITSSNFNKNLFSSSENKNLLAKIA